MGRSVPPFFHDDPHPEKSLFFIYRNASKRGITLNIETEEGRNLLRKLVEKADVLVENFGPGYMDGLGLGYEDLKKINPNIVMASFTEFGLDGPYKNYKGSNIVDFAMSGVMITSGYPGKAPTLLPGMPAYDATAMIADVEIIAALYARSAIGCGQKIDASVHEIARTGLYPWSVPIYSYSLTPGGPLPMPESRLGDAIYPVYPTKDGYIRVIALTPQQWKALVKTLGNPEVLSCRMGKLITQSAMLKTFSPSCLSSPPSSHRWRFGRKAMRRECPYHQSTIYPPSLTARMPTPESSSPR